MLLPFARAVDTAFPCISSFPRAETSHLATRRCIWQREVKFDGYRIQLHKFSTIVSLYSKGGYDFRRKFPELSDAVAELAEPPCVIDAETQGV